MITTSGAVIIDRPASEVFEYVTDVRRSREWSPQMGDIVDPRPMTQGATFVERRRLFGIPTKGKWLIMELEPGRRFKLRVTYGPMRMDYGMTVTPEGASSARVAYDASLDLGAFGFAERLMASEFKKEEATELARLKQILEGARAATP